MYLNSGSQLFALDAATGKEIWTFQAEPPFRGGTGRGPVYGDGRIFAFGNSDLYAVDAKSGKPVPSFGNGGVVPIVRDALRLKYPGKYPADLDPTTLGAVLGAVMFRNRKGQDQAEPVTKTAGPASATGGDR